MASLKEVKTRIASVNSTRKITSAMKMVASSKLHRAQQAIESMLPYETLLNRIMSRFVEGLQGEINSPYVKARSVEKVVIIVYSSNSSLCGGFNANIIKNLKHVIADYRANGITNIRIIPIGRKVAEAVKKAGFVYTNDPMSLLDKPNYADAAEIAAGLMQEFVNGSVDKVDLVYNHFKSTSTQVLTHETYLPLHLTSDEVQAEGTVDYIIEPSMEEMVRLLIPKALQLKLYTVLLDSLASEHAARVVAMQVATDNADELLQDLTLMYNKTRQQAITTELLDIVGGSMQ